MAIKCVGSNADGYWRSKTPRGPLKAPQKALNGPKVGKIGKNQFFSVLQYLEVVLMHPSLPSGIGSLEQVGNVGVWDPKGPLKRPPKARDGPKVGEIGKNLFFFSYAVPGSCTDASVIAIGYWQPSTGG